MTSWFFEESHFPYDKKYCHVSQDKNDNGCYQVYQDQELHIKLKNFLC